MVASGQPYPGQAIGTPGARADGVRRAVTALAAGFALHLAYPRPGWDLLGWVSLVPVLALAATAVSPRRAIVEGWLAGWAFFIPLLRWLAHTMTTFSTLSMPLASLVVLALSAYLALYWGAVAGAIAWSRGRLGGAAIWLAPPFWVTAELLRTYLLSGFPWGLVGYVPYRRLEVIQVAAWTGVYGVSFLIVLVNTALAWIALERTRVSAAIGVAVCALSVGGVLLVGPAHLRSPLAPTLPVGVVQGNIDQAIKWDRTFREETLLIYGELTRRAAPGSRLVIWPEAAVPAYLRHEPSVLGWLTSLASEVGTPILVGAPDARPEGRVTQYLNTAFLVGNRGVLARYDKMHLVPFGEYVPLKGLLFFVDAIAAEIGDFTPGLRRVIFPLEGSPFGTVVCYEVIFPNLFRQFVAEGASFMVNITNDAWFGDSGGPLQHLAMVPLRAVENGVAIVRAANTGVSGLVAPSGAIGPELPLGRRGTLRLEVPIRPGGTFYTRFGDLFAYACGVLSAATLAAGAGAGGGAPVAVRRR